MEIQTLHEEYQISEEEFLLLDTKFGDLVHYAAWQLLKKNCKNNHTDELEDIAQELRMAIVRAGVYYKRQVFIESCFRAAEDHVADKLLNKIIKELGDLWRDRTKHGANRRKFGLHQEKILEGIVTRYVPGEARPERSDPLTIDTKFITYCKAITWNCQKSMGKKITREKGWRSGLVSLSEFDYLGAQN